MKIKTVFTYCSFLAAAFCLYAAAQPNQPSGAKKQWPQLECDHITAVNDAVDSFTAALTRSGYDTDFRKGLIDSCESAKQNVSQEGNIVIPDSVVTMFYEPDAYKDHFGFDLPPFNPKARTEYKYADKEYYKCCFPIAKTFAVTPIDKSLADALNAAMTRAGYDSDFRDRLSASCDSAKQAVSESGTNGPIQIGNKIQMIFKDTARGDKGDERYHIFTLPPFDASSRTPHPYSAHFVGMYPLWPHMPPCESHQK